MTILLNGVDSVNFVYDNDGLLTQSGDLQITRDSSNGRITSTQVGNATTDYTYSNTGELASVDNSVNGSSIYSTNFMRDSLGRITTLTESIEGVTTTKQYKYDIAGRLSEVYDNNSLIAKYYYDANGNRDSVVTPNGTTSGIYDVQDRMLQYGNANYVYTRNGELNLKIEETDTTKYIYDDFGNLISVTLPNRTKVEYIIDGQNRRIGRSVNGVVTNRWIYSGQLYPTAEVDSYGNIIALYYGDYMKRGDTVYSIFHDHLGSVRMVVNLETGEVVKRMDYNEYGVVTLDSNPGFQPFGYAGGLYDSRTKLVRFGARDYDPNVGRWTTKDPIRFKGKQTNLYVYVGDNPINKVDRQGLGSNPCDQTDDLLKKLLDLLRLADKAHNLAELLGLIKDEAEKHPGAGDYLGLIAAESDIVKAELDYENGTISQEELILDDTETVLEYLAGTVGTPLAGFILEADFAGAKYLAWKMAGWLTDLEKHWRELNPDDY